MICPYKCYELYANVMYKNIKVKTDKKPIISRSVSLYFLEICIHDFK